MEQAQVLRRALLQDRMDALLFDMTGEDPTEWSELHSDLSCALSALIAGVARVHPDEIGHVTARVEAAVRESVVDALSA